MVQHANKGLDLIEIVGWCDWKDRIDLLLLWFDTFSVSMKPKYSVSNAQKLDFLVLT
jgi:hypothetical protein